MRALVLPAAAAALFVASTTAGAQSLGDVARKEAERRGTAPAAGKTYTNETLTPDFTTPPPPPATPDAAAVAVKTESATPAAELTEEEAAQQQQEKENVEKWGVTPREQQEPAPADDHNEEFWRSRSALIKARVAGQRTQVDQLRQRMAATRGATDDERDVLERTFAKAEADMKHLNDEWLRFERQARDRKVPEHWWR